MKLQGLDLVLAPADATTPPVPITCIRGPEDLEALTLSERHQAWITANRFTGSAFSTLALPDEAGRFERVLFGLANAEAVEPAGPAEHLVGRLPSLLPAGTYALETPNGDADAAALAWTLGGYRFDAFRTPPKERPRLVLNAGVDAQRVEALASSVWLGRDLINRPANDLGPADLASAVQAIADEHGAEIKTWRGDAPTFSEAFPLVDAVGRASHRPAHVVELVWGDPAAPKVTLVGKGICFDSGGLDIKPAAGMRLMKKDMGGAAAAIALARMIMALRVPLRLRLIITAADNAIAGNAFRPGDIIRSRNGLTVEIGNTDAEGRLVLADGLALAGDTPSDLVVTFATLTGAARVALGPDLPAFFSTDDAFSDQVLTAGTSCGDPVWRLPLWPGYDSDVDGKISDLRNVGDSGLGGAIFAALFLKRFVRQAARFAHFDLYAWRATARALGPAGGEVQCARAMADALTQFAETQQNLN
ncbi:MAG: leucyl aminopeptidase family protein [Pseudomonadota bacterium]